ncbi:hypothetical protein ACQY0O_003260 [Thecaphora frezii]
MPPSPTEIKAIIFDIGSVLVGSPLFAINASYEEKHRLPFQYLNVAITAQGHNGAFQRFERNELDLYTFYAQFGKELSDVQANNRHYTRFCQARKMDELVPHLHSVDGRELFGEMMRQSLNVDPKMAYAIAKLRSTGRYKLAGLTNNFAPPTSLPASASSPGIKVPTLDEELDRLGLGSKQHEILNLFDHYIESAKVG